MSNIFGLPHSISEAFDLLTGSSPLQIFPGLVESPESPQVDELTIGRTCPTGKIKYYTTKVYPDGRTEVKERKSRKRRARLATASDIKDLGALMSVTKGKADINVWIATRGRR